jgi:hypothetical protein
VLALGQLAVTDWANPAGVAKLEVVARKLGITSLVVEDDVQMPASQRALLDRFISSLTKHGFSKTDIGTEVVFRIPGRVRAPIWGSGCKVNDDLFFAGFVHIDCNSPRTSNSTASVVSPFELPAPMASIGLDITDSSKVVDGIGTHLQIKTRSAGWLIFLPNLFAMIGGLITALFFLVLAGRPSVASVMSLYRRSGRGAQSVPIGTTVPD